MAAETIPDVTLGWRLKLSLDHADMSVQDMAEELGVSRTTVAGWLSDRHAPRRAYLRVWALRCRVPFEWLERGQLPREDSNLQPAGLWNDLGLPGFEPRNRATRAELLALTKRIPIVRSDLRQTEERTSHDRLVAR